MQTPACFPKRDSKWDCRSFTQSFARDSGDFIKTLFDVGFN